MGRRTSHWKKKISRKNELAILKLLRESPLRFNELLTRLNEIDCKMSQTTLTNHLKDLEERKLIERYYDSKKKGDYYRICNPESDAISAVFRKYEAMAFIEGINNPLYTYKGKKGRAIAAFTNRTGNQKIDRFMKAFLEKQANFYLRIIKDPKEGRNIAVVLMTGPDIREESEKRVKQSVATK